MCKCVDKFTLLHMCPTQQIHPPMHARIPSLVHLVLPCCSVVQCGAKCCSALQHFARSFFGSYRATMLRCRAVWCDILQCVAVSCALNISCDVLQCLARTCSAVCCSNLRILLSAHAVVPSQSISSLAIVKQCGIQTFNKCA